MAPAAVLRPRTESETTMSPLMVNLMIVFLALSFLGLLLVASLFALRSYRKHNALERELPSYDQTMTSRRSSRHPLTISTNRRPDSIFVYSEKQQLIADTDTPPSSPSSIPEIRITFPEEEDESGKRRSGRVMIVRVTEIGVGLEPMDEEHLPAYQKTDEDRFHSLDLDRIGGLKEQTLVRR